jgi:RNA-dependent RNA polymerase
MDRKSNLSKRDYHSTKILGQLYDAVENVNFVPHLTMPFDSRILDCKPELKELSEGLLDYARSLKEDYDSAVRRVMAQYEIPTEFEVWSSWVITHNGSANNYNISEKVGGLADRLRSGFRQHCYEKMGGRFLEALAPLIVAMYRVTHEDLMTTLDITPYDDESDYEESEHMDSGAAKTSLISFPWMFSEYLGKIAQRHYDLDAITTFAANKADRPAGKIYTQEEAMRLTADLIIEQGSGGPKVETLECENDMVEEVLEDEFIAKPSALDRLIDIMGE